MFISRFYNGLWVCQNIVNVLNQFNFSGKAIAMDLRSKEFYDPMKGWTHLEHRIMRAIRFDYPEEQIKDVLRITRPAVVWFRILHYAAFLPLPSSP